MLLRCGPCSLSVSDMSVDLEDRLEIINGEREAIVLRLEELKVGAKDWHTWDRVIDLAIEKVLNQGDPS